VHEVSPEVVVNDRWQVSRSDVAGGAPSIVRTFEHDPPDAIIDGPWELTRSIGHSFGHNRAESVGDHLTGAEIVALFTETVAKGGHLLLNVGAASDGTIPADQTAPLRDAGWWIRRHHELLARCTPWTTWGDRAVRYLCDSDGSLVIIDVHGGGVFAALGSSEHRVASIDRVGPDGDTPVAFAQEPARLLIDTDDATMHGVGRVAVYRIVHEPAEAPAELFSQPDAEPVDLAPLLLDAPPGSIIQLSDGTYFGPVHVPDRVTLRGLGAHRTIITCAPATEASSTAAPPVVTLGDDAHLEHVHVVGGGARSDRPEPPLVSITGGGSGVLGGRVDGTIEVVADGTSITATRASRVIAIGANGLRVSRCSFAGNRSDIGADIQGGGGHRIESSEFAAHLCSVRLTGTTGATVRGNTISGRWWGVHADHTDDTHVHANRIRSTMRAVDIDGGAHAVVDGNSVSAGDSGCIVEDGAADCEVSGNHWDRCRIGLLTWGSVNLHHHDNVASDLRESEGAHISGP
jgi:alpha-L-fucosidase